MSKPVFAWHPNAESQVGAKPDVKTIAIDKTGYELRVKNGINTNRKNWEVEITCNVAEAVAIRAFLRARRCAESFLWTNPRGEQKTYVCREGWAEKMEGTKLVTFNFKLDEVFEV